MFYITVIEMILLRTSLGYKGIHPTEHTLVKLCPEWQAIFIMFSIILSPCNLSHTQIKIRAP